MQAAEAHDVLLWQRDLPPGLLDQHSPGECGRVAPVELEKIDRLGDAFEVARADGSTEQPQRWPEFEKGLAREADAARLGGTRDPRGDMHRVASDHGPVGQRRPPVQADSDGQLVLARPGRVLARHRLLESDNAVHARLGAGKDAEHAVADGVDDAALRIAGGLAEQVEVQLVQLPADGVAEAREVGRGADDVGEGHQQRPLEAAPQLELQLVLQTNDFRQAEGAEVEHGGGCADDRPIVLRAPGATSASLAEGDDGLRPTLDALRGG